MIRVACADMCINGEKMRLINLINVTLGPVIGETLGRGDEANKCLAVDYVVT